MTDNLSGFYKLRNAILEEMKTNPSMKLSETLRKVDEDILFWSAQTDGSTMGLLRTLTETLNREP